MKCRLWRVWGMVAVPATVAGGVQIEEWGNAKNVTEGEVGDWLLGWTRKVERSLVRFVVMRRMKWCGGTPTTVVGRRGDGEREKTERWGDFLGVVRGRAWLGGTWN
ncbi:hypothetical protein Salat_1073300 [Sesamum alatum]|uniref:Secreted protein n=1 Tax=Sesamum alatum TaxID=300844 RepID=A0AAE1YNQ0_9LAMI|nr:hypothetical protein Salat_1073300 [Sesamum alatum]